LILSLRRTLTRRCGGPRRFAAVPVGRPFRTAALVVVSLFVLAGAAAPQTGPELITSMGTTSASAVALDPRAAFVATATEGFSDGSTVRRYALPDGAPGWATDLPHGVTDLKLDPAALHDLLRHADTNAHLIDEVIKYQADHGNFAQPPATAAAGGDPEPPTPRTKRATRRSGDRSIKPTQ
jgi:hypothetical protein